MSHRIGNLMSHWILTANGRVISRTTVQRVTNLELMTTEVKERCSKYTERMNEILKEDNHVIQGHENEMQLQDWDDYTDDGGDELRLELTLSVERRELQLDCIERHQIVISGVGCGVCYCKSNRRRTCFCVVGA